MKYRFTLLITALFLSLSCSVFSGSGDGKEDATVIHLGNQEIAISAIDNRHSDTKLENINIQHQQQGELLALYIEAPTDTGLQSQFLLLRSDELPAEQSIILSNDRHVTVYEDVEFDPNDWDKHATISANSSWSSLAREVGVYDYVFFLDPGILEYADGYGENTMEIYDSPFAKVKYVWITNSHSSQSKEFVSTAINFQPTLLPFSGLFATHIPIDPHIIEQDTISDIWCSLLSAYKQSLEQMGLHFDLPEYCIQYEVNEKVVNQTTMLAPDDSDEYNTDTTVVEISEDGTLSPFAYSFFVPEEFSIFKDNSSPEDDNIYLEWEVPSKKWRVSLIAFPQPEEYEDLQYTAEGLISFHLGQTSRLISTQQLDVSGHQAVQWTICGPGVTSGGYCGGDLITARDGVFWIIHWSATGIGEDEALQNQFIDQYGAYFDEILHSFTLE